MNRLILAENGRPFPSWDAARDYHDRLAGVLGPQVQSEVQFEVVAHPDGGYALRWCIAGSDRSVDALPVPLATPSYPRTFLRRRALRAGVGQFLGIALGVWMFWAPREFLSWGWDLQVQLDALPYFGRALRLVTVVLGGLLVLDGVARLLWRHLSMRYRFDDSTVSVEGWSFGRYGLQSVRQYIPLSRVRRIESRQHLSERLLGVGRVTLLTGDSDGVDLVLQDLVAPKKLRNELQRRALLAQGTHGQRVGGPGSAPPELTVVRSDTPPDLGVRSITPEERPS